MPVSGFVALLGVGAAGGEPAAGLAVGGEQARAVDSGGAEGVSRGLRSRRLGECGERAAGGRGWGEPRCGAQADQTATRLLFIAFTLAAFVPSIRGACKRATGHLSLGCVCIPTRFWRVGLAGQLKEIELNIMRKTNHDGARRPDGALPLIAGATDASASRRGRAGGPTGPRWPSAARWSATPSRAAAAARSSAAPAARCSATRCQERLSAQPPRLLSPRQRPLRRQPPGLLRTSAATRWARYR